MEGKEGGMMMEGDILCAIKPSSLTLTFPHHRSTFLSHSPNPAPPLLCRSSNHANARPLRIRVWERTTLETEPGIERVEAGQYQSCIGIAATDGQGFTFYHRLRRKCTVWLKHSWRLDKNVAVAAHVRL